MSGKLFSDFKHMSHLVPQFSGRSTARAMLATSCALAAILAVGGHFGRVQAQAQSQPWSFQYVEGADLLFHGLAVVGYQGFSYLPLYDRAYAERVRSAKETKGVYPTGLDQEAGRFLEAFESDSTFELLHFLPLYFGAASTENVLRALTEVSGGGRTQSVDSDAAFGASVVRTVLQREDQRQVLAEFTEAIWEDWNVFLHEYSREAADEYNARLERASTRWNDEIAPAVSAFLETRQMTGGLVIVSPALGPEGRVFAGDPESTDDNVLAVSLAHSETGLGIGAYLLKELCYPVASNVVATLSLARDRIGAERLSGRLAVRCGAELLEAQGSRLAEEYRTTFMAAAIASGVAAQTFDAAYPVDERAMARLRRIIREDGG